MAPSREPALLGLVVDRTAAYSVPPNRTYAASAPPVSSWGAPTAMSSSYRGAAICVRLLRGLGLLTPTTPGFVGKDPMAGLGIHGEPDSALQ